MTDTQQEILRNVLVEIRELKEQVKQLQGTAPLKRLNQRIGEHKRLVGAALSPGPALEISDRTEVRRRGLSCEPLVGLGTEESRQGAHGRIHRPSPHGRSDQWTPWTK
jgi:hypothetical protein